MGSRDGKVRERRYSKEAVHAHTLNAKKERKRQLTETDAKTSEDHVGLRAVCANCSK